MKQLVKYNNGNAEVQIFSDGTRIIEYPDNEPLRLDYPLNIDIRVSSRCPFGLNPKTGKSVCSFCHESARTDGEECDYNVLSKVLTPLPQGTELAIGINEITDRFVSFLQSCNFKGFIVNVTINQGLLSKATNQLLLQNMIISELVKGVGISFRPRMPDIPKWLLEHNNTVVHVIAGIDDFDEVCKLAEQGCKKILVLGEKDFGFNKGNVDLESKSHKKWYKNITKLTELFEVVSFDNLALEQLNLKKRVKPEVWKEFYQGEHSLYINAVEQYFAPSSRSSVLHTPFSKTGVIQYFKTLENQINVRSV